ncbi:hypothetical protein [Deminuibacter soli]|uniref:hypothetical protein n=1 Tax=Deminuibacter soli TaxID=2291815 RepID=UPI0013148542|nr:hypothetical protein [Deminuibacter soli]
MLCIEDTLANHQETEPAVRQDIDILINQVLLDLKPMWEQRSSELMVQMFNSFIVQ